MAECRHLREQRRLDVLARDEQLDRLDARGRRGLDEVLALGDEQAELVAPAPLRQLPNELELLVLPRLDQLRPPCLRSSRPVISDGRTSKARAS
jgi:hypothetical protein